MRPNLFALPPGVDFAAELVRGIDQRLGVDPLALAGAQIWVNTERMRRRVLSTYHQGPARILPEIRLLSDLSPLHPGTPVSGVSSLRRRIELRPLVARFLELRPGLAGPASQLDMTDSLANLLTEMADEDVGLEKIEALDVADSSGHWQTSLNFLKIAKMAGLEPESSALQREMAHEIAQNWAQNPPRSPVFIAGSTGSRGPVFELMQALAHTANGYVILPGYDRHMPGEVWASFEGASNPEDHPQFRFFRLARALGLAPDKIPEWTDAAPSDDGRNKLFSLALRPAPVTDGWLLDGPKLSGLDDICASITLIEAPSPRAEALSVATALRKAAEDGLKAALVTPDRNLARRVRAALDRWRIIPDDSAGDPVIKSPQGKMLMQSARALTSPMSSEDLIVLLSNPVTASGGNRQDHLHFTRLLDLFLRKNAVPEPGPAHLVAFAKETDADTWVDWLIPLVEARLADHVKLADLIESHVQYAELLAAGVDGSDTGRLWAEDEPKATIDSLRIEADHAGVMGVADYLGLLDFTLSAAQGRLAETADPDIMIWGTLEARVQSVDLAILAGLNEGTWPKPPDPDPWLSRSLRLQAGLLAPERRVGLSAHDFQVAGAAKQLIISRAVRDDDAMTVPSRWLSRLTNLLDGLPGPGGPEALKSMRDRGTCWIKLAHELEHDVVFATPEPRPAPAPPVAARPQKMSLTRIKTLKRDPFAIYAEQILDLEPVKPLNPVPDAAIRGQVLHEVYEEFVRQAVRDPSQLTAKSLLDVADRVLVGIDQWPAERRNWRAQTARNAIAFIEQEKARWLEALPSYFELKGQLRLRLKDGSEVTISGRADRLDLSDDGSVRIYDYKSGRIPSEDEQTYFDRQLFILSLMSEAGVFRDKDGPIPPADVLGAEFLGIGTKLDRRKADITPDSLTETRLALIGLLSAYRDPNTGYIARAMMQKDSDVSYYDHLARRGEWDSDAPSVVIEVGRT